ncbi:MAG: hypothetical protein C0514_01195 [Candidatus Puniceispirillum sp.]|nr:hypothetical protein [Candidatus Puniceispirillum sp.]
MKEIFKAIALCVCWNASIWASAQEEAGILDAQEGAPPRRASVSAQEEPQDAKLLRQYLKGQKAFWSAPYMKTSKSTSLLYDFFLKALDAPKDARRSLVIVARDSMVAAKPFEFAQAVIKLSTLELSDCEGILANKHAELKDFAQRQAYPWISGLIASVQRDCAGVMGAYCSFVNTHGQTDTPERESVEVITALTLLAKDELSSFASTQTHAFSSLNMTGDLMESMKHITPQWPVIFNLIHGQDLSAPVGQVYGADEQKMDWQLD